jgi:hypothetical protein
MSENHPRPEITEVEALLQGLKPAAGGLDRDRILFRAGRASARGPGRVAWPVLSAVLGLATVALAVALAARPAPPERVVYVEVNRPDSVPHPMGPERPGDASELPLSPTAPLEQVFVSGGRPLMEQQLLRWGLDALPAPAAQAGPVHRILGVTVQPSDAAVPSWLHLFTFEGKGP